MPSPSPLSLSSGAVVPRKLWEHPDPKSTDMWRFIQHLNQKRSLNLSTFHDLHRWSLAERSSFWSEVFDAANFIHGGSYTQVVDESLPIDAVPQWFPGVTLNYAENILYTRATQGGPSDQRGTVDKEDAKTALTEVREGASAHREMTYGELRAAAGKLAAAMKARGVVKGDRVVIVGANSVETLCVWLATAWLGAIFSSSSTDMGVQGILQRAVQVNPKVGLPDLSPWSGQLTMYPAAIHG